MIKKIFFSGYLVILSILLNAQVSITGIIVDSVDNTPLVGVNVILSSMRDSTRFKGTVTDGQGKFVFVNVREGRYRLKSSYIGYSPYKQIVFVGATNVSLNTIKMQSSATMLNNAVVEAKALIVEQKGDTSQYNAAAIKVNPDANAEDLVAKMPGVVIENNQIKARGEEIKQVMVDGKPFYGDDPTLGLKNLPAEVVDKIQIFDRLSDQAQFTGFDDGQSIRTMNIITKSGKNEGQFGKAYIGYGNNERYIAGGNVNLFKGNRRLSILGLTNNVNQQNFSTQDIASATGSDNSMPSFSSMMPSNFRGGRRGGSYGGSRGADISDFMVGQMNGITTTHAIGINYNNNFGKKTRLYSSYFFNKSINNAIAKLSREFILESDSGLVYNENNTSEVINNNHRINLRIEYDIDSMNSIIFTPRFNLQQTLSDATLQGVNTYSKNILQNSTFNENSSDNLAYNYTGELLIRHKFKKRGRTISWSIRTEGNNRYKESDLYSINRYYYSVSDTSIINQYANQITTGYRHSSRITYTEPIKQNGQLEINYTPSFSKNYTDKKTDNFDYIFNFYSIMDTALSNKYENIIFSNNIGGTYRVKIKEINLSAGVNYENSLLQGDQTFPYAYDVKKSFNSILPNASLSYRIKTTRNLWARYRASADIPSVSQLQDVIDNSNTLFLNTGNPDLVQSYRHTLMTRYSNTNVSKSTSLFLFLYANFTDNYIGNSTFIPTTDTILSNGILMTRGMQLTRPINLDNYYTTRTFLTYGLTVKKIKSTVNFNLGFNYNHIPSKINTNINIANNYNFTGGFVVASNISEKVDFSLSYSGNYSIVINSLQSTSDNNYYYQNTAFKFNWIYNERYLLNTNTVYSWYTGLTNSYNKSFWILNAAIGYRMLKDKLLEIKLGAYDILNQNNNINRTVTETYIEDNISNTLQRYYLLTLTYTLKKYKKPNDILNPAIDMNK